MTTISISTASVAAIAGHFLSHIEDMRSGFEEGLYETGPRDIHLRAEKWIEDVRPADASANEIEVPEDIAGIMRDGARHHLTDWASGLEDGTYEDAYPDDADAALDEFETRLAAVPLSPGA